MKSHLTTNPWPERSTMGERYNNRWGKSKTRFARFQSALRHETGDKAVELKDGQVMIVKNEFSPERWFASLQQAIDHFARYMPDDLK